MIGAKYVRDIGTFPRDVAIVWRHEGLSSVVRVVLERTLFRLYRRGHFLVIRGDSAAVSDRSPPPGIRIDTLQGADLARVAAIASTRRLHYFHHGTEREGMLLGAWRGSELIGYISAIASDGPGAEFSSLPLPKGIPYVWQLFVIRSERRSGIASALIAGLAQMGRGHGYDAYGMLIRAKNRASLRTTHKMTGGDATVLGSIYTVKVLARTYSRYRPLDPPRPLAAFVRNSDKEFPSSPRRRGSSVVQMLEDTGFPLPRE